MEAILRNKFIITNNDDDRIYKDEMLEFFNNEIKKSEPLDVKDVEKFVKNKKVKNSK